MARGRMKYQFNQRKADLRSQQEQQMQALLNSMQSNFTPIQYGQEGTGETPPVEGAGETPPADESLGDPGKRALEAERARVKELSEQLKQFQRQLQAYGDVDPALARKASEKLREMEEAEAKRAAYEAELKAKLEEEFKPQVEAANKQAIAAKTELQQYRQEVFWQQAFMDADGCKGEYIAVKEELMRHSRLDEKGNVVILDDEGRPAYVPDEKGTARPMTAKERIVELMKKPDYLWFAKHFKGSDVGGVGLNGNGSSMLNNPALANLPAWEQVNRMRTGS